MPPARARQDIIDELRREKERQAKEAANSHDDEQDESVDDEGKSLNTSISSEASSVGACPMMAGL